MTVLINILFIILNPIANNQIQNHKNDYIHFDYIHFEIVNDSFAESTPENYFSNSDQGIKNINDNQSITANSSVNIFNDVDQNSFLNRLLPFLIDVPPPSFHLF